MEKRPNSGVWIRRDQSSSFFSSSFSESPFFFFFCLSLCLLDDILADRLNDFFSVFRIDFPVFDGFNGVFANVLELVCESLLGFFHRLFGNVPSSRERMVKVHDNRVNQVNHGRHRSDDGKMEKPGNLKHHEGSDQDNRNHGEQEFKARWKPVIGKTHPGCSV